MPSNCSKHPGFVVVENPNPDGKASESECIVCIFEGLHKGMKDEEFNEALYLRMAEHGQSIAKRIISPENQDMLQAAAVYGDDATGQQMLVTFLRALQSETQAQITHVTLKQLHDKAFTKIMRSSGVETMHFLVNLVKHEETVKQRQIEQSQDVIDKLKQMMKETEEHQDRRRRSPSGLFVHDDHEAPAAMAEEQSAPDVEDEEALASASNSLRKASPGVSGATSRGLKRLSTGSWNDKTPKQGASIGESALDDEAGLTKKRRSKRKGNRNEAPPQDPKRRKTVKTSLRAKSTADYSMEEEHLRASKGNDRDGSSEPDGTLKASEPDSKAAKAAEKFYETPYQAYPNVAPKHVVIKRESTPVSWADWSELKSLPSIDYKGLRVGGTFTAKYESEDAEGDEKECPAYILEIKQSPEHVQTYVLILWYEKVEDLPKKARDKLPKDRAWVLTNWTHVLSILSIDGPELDAEVENGKMSFTEDFVYHCMNKTVVARSAKSMQWIPTKLDTDGEGADAKASKTLASRSKEQKPEKLKK